MLYLLALDLVTFGTYRYLSIDFFDSILYEVYEVYEVLYKVLYEVLYEVLKYGYFYYNYYNIQYWNSIFTAPVIVGIVLGR